MKKVLILGSMNNLPTCYSLDLSFLGADVIQVTGFSKRYQLHDPDNFLSKEQLAKFRVLRLPFFHNFLLPVIIGLYSFLLIKILPKGWSPDVVIFNDTYLTMAKKFKSSIRIFLPHGGDIETWCGFNGSTPSLLCESMKDAGIFKLMPRTIRKKYISFLIASFQRNLKLMDVIVYFPEAFTSVTKKINDYCTKNKISYLERYDISLGPLSGFKKNKISNMKSEGFRVLVPVRFSYKTFPEGNDEFNKGSDLIIEGIEKFLELVSDVSNVEVVFYEKGADVYSAKKLVANMPILNSVLTWKQSVPFNDFLKELNDADFCFDSVGEHWPGAVAAYALALGVTVGANFDKVRHLLPTEDLPHLYNINTEEKICDALVRCYKEARSDRVPPRLLKKVRDSYSTMNVANRIFNLS